LSPSACVILDLEIASRMACDPMDIDDSPLAQSLNDLRFGDTFKPLESAPETSEEPQIILPKIGTPRTLVSRKTPAVTQVYAPSDEDSLRKAALYPYVLSGYVQLAFSIAIAAFWLYLLTAFANTIFADIESKVQLFSEDVLEQITKCSRDYRENKCDPLTRVPAAATACAAWEACMSRDPYVVARRSKMSAETIGESLNSFFEALTWKTIACLVLLSGGLLICYNAASCLTRNSVSRAFDDQPRYRAAKSKKPLAIE
jgi:Di-sulfide bridge nucleocytoplasmic transport domain